MSIKQPGICEHKQVIRHSYRGYWECWDCNAAFTDSEMDLRTLLVRIESRLKRIEERIQGCEDKDQQER